jgi:hypothetical protein
MSALGQKQTSDCRLFMSAIPPKADMDGYSPNVSFVPKADSCTAAKRPVAGLSLGFVRPHKAAAALQAPGGLEGRFLTRLWRTSLGDCGHLI